MNPAREGYVKLEQVRPCDKCSLCCKVMSIGDYGGPVKKPMMQWCQFCKPGKGGCSIYPDRPEECRTFHCLWAAGLPALETRPDKLHVVFATTDEHEYLNCFVDHGYESAYAKFEVRRFIVHMVLGGMKMKVWLGKQGRRLVIRGDQCAVLIDRDQHDRYLPKEAQKLLDDKHCFELEMYPFEPSPGLKQVQLKGLVSVWKPQA